MRERQGHISYLNCGLYVCERERRSQCTARQKVLIAACLHIHKSIITESVMLLSPPFRLELMVQLRTLLTVFTLVLKAEDCSRYLDCLNQA